MNKWQRFKKWWSGGREGWIQCDVCGEWGQPNPNYNIPTFVHFNKHTGAAYMHFEHLVDQQIWEIKNNKSN